MKKFMMLFTMLTMFFAMGFTAYANGLGENEQSAQTVVALGADLSAEQRAEVLELMGLTEETLAQCTVITITNDMEHRYLDQYIDSSVIGTKSLSSVILRKAEAGNGVLVTTKNINYCTTGIEMLY